MGFLRSSDGLTLFGSRRGYLYLECGPLFESGMLPPSIQHWLLRIRPSWWFARSYRTDQLFLERGHILDSLERVPGGCSTS